MTTGSQAVSSVADALAAARRHAYAVLEHVGRRTRTVVNSFNGEPATVLDALEAAGDHLTDAAQPAPARDPERGERAHADNHLPDPA